MSATPTHVWVLLAALLAVSGFLSASETALFSLSPRDLPRASARVGHLLGEPRDLLITILFGNLIVNVLFFAFASQVSLGEAEHADLVGGLGALIVLLLAGEILPKTLALRAPIRVADAGVLPLGALVALLGPVRRFVTSILEAIVRALGDAGREEHGLTTELLASVLTRSDAEGVLAGDEAGILSEIVELGGIRVREIMTPRVDALLLDVSEDPRPLVRAALDKKLTWLPVVDGSKDEVKGYVNLRDLLLPDQKPLRQLVMPVKFVPEVARVLDLLHEFREDEASEAVVVDEWGGTAGVVTIEDVFEEIVGELRVEGEAREKPVVPLGEGRFRVSGALSVRDWNAEFGRRVVPTEFETVGGFVTALLGRIPRTGDKVRTGALVCEVREVRGRRVQQVDMYVEPEEAP